MAMSSRMPVLSRHPDPLKDAGGPTCRSSRRRMTLLVVDYWPAFPQGQICHNVKRSPTSSKQDHIAKLLREIIHQIDEDKLERETPMDSQQVILISTLWCTSSRSVRVLDTHHDCSSSFPS